MYEWFVHYESDCSCVHCQKCFFFIVFIKWPLAFLLVMLSLKFRTSIMLWACRSSSFKHVCFWYPFCEPNRTTNYSKFGWPVKKLNWMRVVYLMLGCGFKTLVVQNTPSKDFTSSKGFILDVSLKMVSRTRRSSFFMEYRQGLGWMWCHLSATSFFHALYPISSVSALGFKTYF